ncbi:serine/threonine protein kinase with two-component sensor domain [Nostoc commune NIES-4072]|uniref:Serine/threonine protein kinase with two-component sensor domain n=1 Tax=Nostoc commune NIES-4072 TaxID=2005467 RepID=A0A2R5FW53_NOSCO|nr:serine/threonine protein kinase with two-component sensor domain [Nostoc commune HK-02]GBG22289.1 serine/threonine protein kinase with two-component sensor domain [Nostoc commune NIES-4072]
MAQLLSESDAQLQVWKTKILEAVGDNGQVLDYQLAIQLW